MKSNMEKTFDKDLKKLIKLERSQKKLVNYVVKVGKWLLFVLPVALVVITLLTLFLFPELPEALTFSEQTPEYQILTITYFIVLALYFVNSILLFLTSTKSVSIKSLYSKFNILLNSPMKPFK